MEKPLFVENTITINAPIRKVWDALTLPEETKKYMFGCETVSDWKKGSSLDWKGVHEGKETVFVHGVIREIQSPKFLAYTTNDSHSAIQDTPENSIVVTYTLTEQNGATTLVVTQGDYSKVVDREKRYKEAVNNGEGWNPILQEIKRLIEHG